MSAFTEAEQRKLQRYAAWLERALPDMTADSKLLADGRELLKGLTPRALARATVEDRRALTRRAAALKAELRRERDQRWEKWASIELDLLDPDGP